jgi:hypothetical protein
MPTTPEGPGTVPPPPVALRPPGEIPPGSTGTAPPAQTTTPLERRELLARTDSSAGCPDPDAARDPNAPRDPNVPKTDDPRRVDCPRETVRKEATDERQFGSGPPLTPGREFAVQPLWNLTVDGTYTDTSDRRHGVDIDGYGSNVTVGLDRLLTGTLVAGANLSIAYNHTKQFHGISKSESIGLTLSPYVAFEILPRWTLDISPGFGWTQNDNDIGPLNASYTSLTYSGSVTASGDYDLVGFSLRPKLSAYYAHTDNEAYDTKGTVRGVPISLRSEESSFNFGVADFSVEVNRTFTTPGGMPIVPYIEVGVSYEFERPNDGKIMTKDLTLVDSSPWSGQVRVGVRAMFTSSTFIEAKAAYLSLGVNDLDLWEFGLFLSHGF